MLNFSVFSDQKVPKNLLTNQVLVIQLGGNPVGTFPNPGKFCFLLADRSTGNCYTLNFERNKFYRNRNVLYRKISSLPEI